MRIRDSRRWWPNRGRRRGPGICPGEWPAGRWQFPSSGPARCAGNRGNCRTGRRQSRHVLQRLDRVFGVDRDVSSLILLGAAKRPEQRAHGHTAVEFLREPQTAGMAGRAADLLGADAELFISVRAIRETRLGPPVLVPIAWIGDVGIGKSEITPGLWIVGGPVGKIDFLAVPLLDLLVDLGHIDGLLLIGRRGREQHDEVVPPAGRSLRGGLRGEVDEIDVVNSDVGVVLLPPLLAKGPVKPGVVGGNEVTPLENLQSLLLGRSAFRKQEKRPRRSAKSKSAGSRQPDEVTT